MFDMKKFITTSFMVLALVAEVQAYDQVAEASSPGKWNEDVVFRITARCNGNCVPYSSNIKVSFLVPDGWEMKPNDNVIWGNGYATCNFNNNGIFNPGTEMILSQMANNISQQHDSGTFTCEKGFSVRRVKNFAGLTFQVRRNSDSGNINFVRVYSRNGGGAALKIQNLTGGWTGIENLSRQMASSVPSLIAIQYNSKINLSSGKTKPIFQVSDAYGSYTVNVNIVGDASGDLTLVNSSGSTGNYVCNGSLKNGEECKIKANSKIRWYGQKQATANITLSII
ncbi:hypothetical protein VW37_004538 [Salmonella enterica subsp. houtenae serovar 51:z4,z23:-]|nr:hypothetical protein [Salmonella enterica subsp. houtenae serovar 51:z4,z23:-]